jgi:hypothetical protein
LGTNNAVVVNQWIHVAFTLDGKARKLYVNGVLADSIATTILPFKLNATNENLLGAAYSGNTTAPAFMGAMDEVRIWNFARSQTQISSNRFVRISPNAKGLTLYYQFDETTGNVAADRSPNGRNATLNNFTGTAWATSSLTNFSPFTYTWTPTQGLSSTTTKSTTLTPTISTSYTVNVTSSNGCTESKSVNVIVNSPLAITQRPNNTDVCNGADARFVIKTNNARINYLWQQSSDSGNSWSDRPNQTDSVLLLSGVTIADHNKLFRCKVS